MKTTIPTAIAVFVLGTAGAAVAAEPISRPLADVPGVTRPHVKQATRTPSPMVNVLRASLDAQGRISVTCSEAENPAYRAWRESAARRGVQER